MNCINCNTPGAPHEIIDGLCHRCTADKLKRLRNSIGSNICLHHNDAARLEALKRCPVCDMYNAESRKESCVNMSDFIFKLREHLIRYNNLKFKRLIGLGTVREETIAVSVPREAISDKQFEGKLGDLEI